MDAGDLIPDSVVIGLVAERLSHTDTANRGFVLDGFPRTVAQAEALAELLAPRGLDLVIDLEVETEVVLKRLASRRVCEDCGANYSAKQPPKVDWVCDICGGEVVQRQDDTEGAIRRRLELYERETAPLIAWYAAQSMLVGVNGMGAPDEVSARLVREVDDARQRGLLDAARQLAAAQLESAVEPVPSPVPSPVSSSVLESSPPPGASPSFSSPESASTSALMSWSIAASGSSMSGSQSEEARPAWS
jgi:adenylate kinase